MNATESRERRWAWTAIVGAPALVAAGALGAYLYMRPSSTSRAAEPAHPAASAATLRPDVIITLAPDAIARAGIQTSAVRRGRATRQIQLPGIVEPNAYRQVVVMSVAAGQVRSVPAELGARVRQGQVLATIHSPELAEAERVYVSMRAELEAAHQRLARLEGLVKIGAASQQELEVARAEHSQHATDVEGVRAKLVLLGLTADQVGVLVDATRIDSMVSAVSPIGGVVTRRAINQGQNIDASTELFTVADLSTVWIVGDMYERDLARLRVGSAAVVTSAALPGRTWNGQVSYIDQQIAVETRTARLRIEVANPGERLRFGTYVDLTVREPTQATVLLVPRSAIQSIGSESVAYVADAGGSGRFIERGVRLGGTSGEEVEVVAGLSEGEAVVTNGSFLLRAERERLGFGPPAVAPASATAGAVIR